MVLCPYCSSENIDGADVCEECQQPLDFLTKPHEKGGLDFGTVGSSAVLGGVLLVLVLMATWYQRREPRQALEMS